MKQDKPKPVRNALGGQFKQKCKEVLKQEPKNNLTSCFKDSSLVLDITSFTPEDLPFFQIMVGLPIIKIVVNTPDPATEKSPRKNKNQDPQAVQVKTFPETAKFRQFMGCIGQAIETNSHLKILRVQRVPISIRALKQLNEGIKKSQYLRQLGLVGCGLGEDHLQSIKQSICQNKSLMTLDLSQNQLCDVGGMIGHILAEHARRRNQVVFFLNIRGEMPVDDLSNIGICELNLEHNRLTDKTICELVNFLKPDSWTRCINLKNNLIKVEGVRQLALMLKINSSLISLDLRGNEGLTKQYSRYIYKKLVLNMQKYKQQRDQFQKSRGESGMKRDGDSSHNSPLRQKEIDADVEIPLQKYKSVKQNYYSQYNSKEYTTIAEPQRQNDKNNMTVDRKIRVPVQEHKSVHPECSNCKAKTFQMLRLEKKNLDLQLQLRKVKHALLTKNIDISAILPSTQPNNNQSALQWISNKSKDNQNDDELLQRMQQIMLQLTRVIQTIQQHQHTKVDISNPLDNPNSFSNTLQLYDKNSKLQELGQEIEEEQRLTAVLNGSQQISRV